MASSQNKTSILRFTLQYLFVSVALSLGLTIFAYWDIISLRYGSSFFENSDISVEGQALFADGFKNSLDVNVSDLLPIAFTLLLASLVAYTLYNSYKFTVYDLDVNHNYVNAQKVHTMRIVLHYVAIYTGAFILPLLFWCFYFISIFPSIAKLPLNSIIGASALEFTLTALGSFIGLVLVTHLGITMTRITAKILKKK